MANGTPDAQYAALDQRVKGIESAIGGLSSQLSVLAAKMDDRSRTPWATIISAMGVVLAIVVAGGQLAKAPIDQALTRLEADARMAVPQASFQEFKATYENNRLTSRADNNAKFAEIDRIVGTSVPRAEHEQIWEAQSRTDLDQQRQIDETKAALSGLYGAKDFFKELSERQSRLEQILTELLTQRRATQ